MYCVNSCHLVSFSSEHVLQQYGRLRVWEWRLHQIHTHLWRHGPLQRQVRWEAVLLQWVCVCVLWMLAAVVKSTCRSNSLCLCSANRVCKKGYKRCVNGRCVGHSSWCNGRDDCGDNSDELFCNGKTNCSYTIYICISSFAFFSFATLLFKSLE